MEIPFFFNFGIISKKNWYLFLRYKLPWFVWLKDANTAKEDICLLQFYFILIYTDCLAFTQTQSPPRKFRKAYQVINGWGGSDSIPLYSLDITTSLCLVYLRITLLIHIDSEGKYFKLISTDIWGIKLHPEFENLSLEYLVLKIFLNILTMRTTNSSTHSLHKFLLTVLIHDYSG